MSKFFDLRFVIGAFFFIVGILLLAYGFISAKNEMQNVNRWCGIIFFVFGGIMILLSYRKRSEEKA